MADYFNTSIDFIVGHTTDRRRIEYTEVYRLNAYEADIINRFRSLTSNEQQCIDLTIKTFLEKWKERTHFRVRSLFLFNFRLTLRTEQSFSHQEIPFTRSSPRRADPRPAR